MTKDHFNAQAKKFRDDLFHLFIDFFCQDQTLDLKSRIEELEKFIIVKILSETKGNQKKAARILGLKYTTLNEKVKRYGIQLKNGDTHPII